MPTVFADVFVHDEKTAILKLRGLPVSEIKNLINLVSSEGVSISGTTEKPEGSTRSNVVLVLKYKRPAA